jgi:hypothetical protein
MTVAKQVFAPAPPSSTVTLIMSGYKKMPLSRPMKILQELIQHICEEGLRNRKRGIRRRFRKYTVKKRLAIFPSPARMSLSVSNSPWRGII